MEIKGKKILVVGLGRSGIAAIKALSSIGGIVSIQDAKGPESLDPEVLDYLNKMDVTCYLGNVPESMDFDLIVLSPGVSASMDFIQEGKDRGIEVIGELELAYRLSKGKYVAITGTNGKTTTTRWVGDIFEAAGKKTSVVGNIGKAAVSEAIASDEDTWFVTEVSSFQLETTQEFHPVVSAILNLTPDHLDRHKTMENYGATKARIFKQQGPEDFVVVNFDDKEALSLTTTAKATVVPFSTTEQLMFGAFVKNDRIVIKNRDKKLVEFCLVEELNLPGTHNLENALAAAAICYFAGIEEDVITQVLSTFKGVEHRTETCGIINGVKYVNDSKATNVSATIKAIEAIDGPIILIAGGYDKDADFEELIKGFGDKVIHAVLLGTTAVKIKEAAEKAGFSNTTMVQDMEACVKEGARIASPGDTVLLSPACASWDMYKSFEERGCHFKEWVNQLKDKDQ